MTAASCSRRETFRPITAPVPARIVCQISDLHIRAPGLISYGVVDCAAMLARCVAEVLRMPQRPEVVVVTGDLTDQGRPEEYAHLRRLLAPLPMAALKPRLVGPAVTSGRIAGFAVNPNDRSHYFVPRFKRFFKDLD